jgi:alpha-amylase/alpha-mannosidase (GH57 family)
MDRYVCVHGHFYQPPRENPWLEVVEEQDSAWPFHDWNERITAECYRPNSSARMLDAEGRITRLVNNYARMSFNVGPTLLQWMDDHSPEAYAGIVEGDRRSQQRFDGHGSAMAQVYNHMIMPLANERDRRTQIVWGIRDFQHRFGRDPEGMWLAETAADTPTLELLAEHGIRFTVLSPYQAARTRELGAESWDDVRGGRVDPTRPYRVPLPSGREIAVFFYDGDASQAVAFEGLLTSGDALADRLLGRFTDRDGPQLVHIATDGESYGHHHRHGEMALAHALHRLETRTPGVKLTNYAQFLDLFPPTHEAEIVEASSWSCAHGVERWRSNCGCSTGGPGDQAWRAPLRDALDWLHDELAPDFERHAKELVHDPWAARDDYVEVVLDRSRDSIDAFLLQHARAPLGRERVHDLLRLMELQRHAMLMYTSCGWFFEELSRLEAVQVLHYAARAIQLRSQLPDGLDLQPEFARRLDAAPSNVPAFGNGRVVYEQLVLPSIAHFEKVAAHFAISRLFTSYHPQDRIGCYEVERSDERTSEAGRARVASGRVTVRSVVTLRERRYEYGVLHFGDHNLLCGIREVGTDGDFTRMADDLDDAFSEANFTDTLRTLDHHFPGDGYSLKDLFRDEQRRLLRIVLDDTLHDVESTYRAIYQGRARRMRWLTSLDAKVPPPLLAAAQVVMNAELRDAFANGTDPLEVRAWIEEADRFGVPLDAATLEHAYAGAIDRTTRRPAAAPGAPPRSPPAEDVPRMSSDDLDAFEFAPECTFV